MTIRRTGWAIALMILTLNSASEKVIIADYSLIGHWQSLVFMPTCQHIVKKNCQGGNLRGGDTKVILDSVAVQLCSASATDPVVHILPLFRLIIRRRCGEARLREVVLNFILDKYTHSGYLYPQEVYPWRKAPRKG